MLHQLLLLMIVLVIQIETISFYCSKGSNVSAGESDESQKLPSFWHSLVVHIVYLDIMGWIICNG